ncbi:MAG: hypothetical protein GY914_04145 [Prochlorococcus sp.]|jgi:hypothetical protein|nr:hypothetical protein [Prochlorococcus sp.]CAI8154768.1 MAG: Uncharacterised protein [Prochlorococcus marinus str. MIT 9215]
MYSSQSNSGKERVFNNADDFAIAFDQAWQQCHAQKKDSELSKDEKLEIVLTEISDHPFLMDSPSMAREVAEFRIRLLNLF